jgi:hypothetical protein
MILATDQGDPVDPPNVERKLAASLSADVVGYSRVRDNLIAWGRDRHTTQCGLAFATLYQR